MTNLGERTGTGGSGTGIITNDDDYLLDIPEEVNPEDTSYANVKDARSL